MSKLMQTMDYKPISDLKSQLMGLNANCGVAYREPHLDFKLHLQLGFLVLNSQVLKWSPTWG